jgi:hypothetical protein
MEKFRHKDWMPAQLGDEVPQDGDLFQEIECRQHEAKPGVRFVRKIKLMHPIAIDTTLSKAYLVARYARQLEQLIHERVAPEEN